MNKASSLKKLQEVIQNCSQCKDVGLGLMVFGEGDINAKTMFVGEAPGKQEAKSGRPFIGRSGQLLRKMIREVGLTEEGVYITSPVKYLPKRGTPSKKEIAHSKTHFDEQLKIINPEVVILLGKTAGIAVTGKEFPVLKEHGKVFHLLGRTVIPTLHPAAVLRFPKYAPLMKEDFVKIKGLVTE